MKSRQVTHKEMQEYYFRESTKMTARSLCVMMIALNEEFGFSGKRIRRLFKRYMEINRRINDYCDNVRLEVEIRERLGKMKVADIADGLLKIHDIKEYRQEIKLQNRFNEKEADNVFEVMKKIRGAL